MKYRLIFFGCCLALYIMAGETALKIDLRGSWQFITQDNKDFATMNWDDSNWDTIKVPGSWEKQGYSEYDGYAWYRYHVKIPNALKNKGITLRLGKIDDVDRVYINGHYLQGRGSFPPNYITAYNWDRQYLIPPDFIDFNGENVIAVRVYDEWGEGGIVADPVGIYCQKIINLEIDLSGSWAFMPGDNPEYSKVDYNDDRWGKIQVPSPWETQTSDNPNDFAWYRKKVIVPKSLDKDKVILTLGRIGDSDEVFFNGIRIARNPNFPAKNEKISANAWQQERFYYIPSHIIQWNHANVIAVRVYHVQNMGGIYEGPVGLTSQKALIEYKSK